MARKKVADLLVDVLVEQEFSEFTAFLATRSTELQTRFAPRKRFSGFT